MHPPRVQTFAFTIRPVSSHLSRIPPLRPLRPPNARVFTHRAPLQLIGNPTLRPQLQFLYPTRPHALFIMRALSTEQKASIRYQLRLGVYWTLMGWVVVGGLLVGYFVLRQDWLDRKYPCPEGWNFMSRYAWRHGRHEEDEEMYGRGMTDWAVVGVAFRNVQNFCEQGMGTKWKKQPLLPNTEWDRTIPGLDQEGFQREPVSPISGVEKTGYDASDKPEAWRRAYFHALMGIAKAAEMSVGFVRDKKRHILFPADQVIGPSNPEPKPIWHNSPPAPLEEDCEPAYDPPELWYTRILTTGGLSRDQMLEAALAFASWEDYRGNASKAQEVYAWSLKFAAGPTNLVDSSTGVIHPNAPYTTNNILSTTTALASHQARSGDLKQALSIYLSILRARRAAPEAAQQYPPKGPDFSLTSVDRVLRWITLLPFRSNMSPPPLSGDVQFQRTVASKCEDAALMNYIGEILFATAVGSQGRREALSWTRDAVAIAERGHVDKQLTDPARRLCTQCLGSGLENWHKMVGVFARDEEERKMGMQKGLAPAVETKRGWKFWARTNDARDSPEMEDEKEQGQWAREEEMVAARRAAFLDAKIMAQLNRHISTKSSWFVV